MENHQQFFTQNGSRSTCNTKSQTSYFPSSVFVCSVKKVRHRDMARIISGDACATLTSSALRHVICESSSHLAG